MRKKGFVPEVLRPYCRENRDEWWRKRKNRENTELVEPNCREKWAKFQEKNGRWWEDNDDCVGSQA